MSNDVYDYIIVGAGAAGATLAERLSGQTRASVLVLESGGPDLDPLFHIPKGFYFLYGGKKYSFYYDTQPLRQSGEPDRWQRGRVDGGSTSTNGLQYDRAGEHFWNSVGDAAGSRWNWSEMLPLYRSLESHELGASPVHGGRGLLPIHVSRIEEPLNKAMIEAAQSYGLPWTPDLNEHDGERVSTIPNITKNGRRRSTARSFLARAQKRPNVTHLHHAHAVRVLFDGRRASGVETLVKGQRRLFRANREIILSGGALESPQLLERSGIGQPEVLRNIGVPQVTESPHVGEHATEQRMFSYQWRINQQMGDNRKLSTGLRQMFTGAKYLISRSDVISTGAYDIGMFAKSEQSLEVPDLFLQFNPFMVDLAASGLAVAPDPGISGIGYQVGPVTESSIHATSADPFAPPVVEARYLEEQSEQEVQHRMLQIVREIVAESPLADLIAEEQSPGPNVQTPEQTLAHSWASGHALHATGTARMGSDDDSVVDPSLRVRGVDGLRVADASVLPRQPANTMAPTIGVGARAAQLILEEE